MDSFTLSPSPNEDCSWVSIGPFASAFRAGKMLESTSKYPLPTCWSTNPSAGYGSGTVLVHDVDMRVPAESGQWRVARLLNPFGELAGGIVWNESLIGHELTDVARLIHTMEDNGAPVICNMEPAAVRAQGIRFIGRYSWDQVIKKPTHAQQKKPMSTATIEDGEVATIGGGEQEGPEKQSTPWDREEDEESEEHKALNPTVDEDDLWTITQGPTCFFTSPTILETEIQSFAQSKLTELHTFADRRVEEVLASREKAKAEKEAKKAAAAEDDEEEDHDDNENPDMEEMNPQEIRETILYDRDSDENREHFLPAQKVYSQGVGFTFTDDEYLFGRLWFSPSAMDDSTQSQQQQQQSQQAKCKAFCFFTYCAPDFFGQMTLQSLNDSEQRIPICPGLPLVSSDVAQHYMKSLTELLLAISADEELKKILQGMTKPFLDALLEYGMEKHTAFIDRVFGGPSMILPLNEETFSKLFRKSMMLERVNESSMESLLSYVSDEVLQEVGQKEIKRFQMVHEGILTGKLNVNTLFSGDGDGDDLEHRMIMTMPSHLAFHIFDRPDIAKEMIARGFPVNSMLAAVDEMDGAWFRTVLAEAAFNGDTDAVEMLLDAGADVEESVGGDPWNAIVYAVASGEEEMMDIFRERFPNHPVWRSNTIPLKMKTLPRRDPWENCKTEGNSSKTQTVEETVPVGSVDDLVAAFAEEERRLQMEEMANANGKGFGGFGGFGNNGASGGAGFSFSSNF